MVDFCLGAKGNIIYTDTENKKETYDIVKNFLIDEEIEIKLILTPKGVKNADKSGGKVFSFIHFGKHTKDNIADRMK